MANEMHLTEPLLPPLSRFVRLLRRSWKTRRITNNGEFVVRLEKRLKEKLDVKDVVLTSSCTQGVQLLLDSIERDGNIVTSPFVFPAIVPSVRRLGMFVRFADVDDDTWNVTPDSVGSRVDSSTRCLFPVHLFGNPCDVVELDRIASEEAVPIFYDGAAAFGTDVRRRSVLSWGTGSVFSTHATKVFTTAEGGAICTSKKTGALLRLRRNFAILGEDAYGPHGTNAKMSELHAALGLESLRMVSRSVRKRKRWTDLYVDLLAKYVRFQRPGSGRTKYNYSYMPIRVHKATRGKLYSRLKHMGVDVRMYYWMEKGTQVRDCPTASALAKEVILLPMHQNLDESDVRKVSRVVVDEVKHV